MTDFSKLAGQTVDGFYYLTDYEDVAADDEGSYDGGKTWSAESRYVGVLVDDLKDTASTLHTREPFYRRPVATTQPTQPVAHCERCEELERVILAADKLVSASDDVGGIRSLMIASDEYTAARS
jgi:hypothetical protein